MAKKFPDEILRVQKEPNGKFLVEIPELELQIASSTKSRAVDLAFARIREANGDSTADAQRLTGIAVEMAVLGQERRDILDRLKSTKKLAATELLEEREETLQACEVLDETYCIEAALGHEVRCVAFRPEADFDNDGDMDHRYVWYFGKRIK